MAPLNKNVMPDDGYVSNNANRDHKERSRNWDDNAHMSDEAGKANIENERRNLNPDQEKRTGSYNPDRDRRR